MIRRLISAAAVVAGCIAVLVLAGAGGNGAQGKTIKIAFDNAFGITQGGDMRVAGVKAGQTTDFNVSKGPECQLGHAQTNPPRTCAIVTAQVTRPGFESFRSDASCTIKQQSLIGEYYVDCQPGSSSRPLGSSTIPDTQTTSTIPTDLVGDIMRQPYRDRLRLIIGELGTGLAGRPQDVAELLHHASPALQQTDRVLNILANQHQIIQNFITDSNTVVTQLDQRKTEVARWIQEAGRTAQISATRAADIESGIQSFPGFLDGLRQNMLRLGQLVDAQTPTLHELQGAAPALKNFLTELGPFSSANIPNFQSLGQAAVVGIKAFKDSKRDIDELNALAQDAPATAKPLRQFLQTLDDRNRSVEPDIRAQPTAPPAPDPTVFHAGQGFTGMESAINYFYWQTLALNQFDQISHVLSSVNNIDPICSNYLTAADLKGSASADAARKRCNTYLGPFQPGITAPDPTSRGALTPTTSNSASKSASAARGGYPATSPLPGQANYSQPNPSLPASTQQILQSLGQSGQLPSVPGTGTTPSIISVPGSAGGTNNSAPPDPSTIAHALDYLLAP